MPKPPQFTGRTRYQEPLPAAGTAASVAQRLVVSLARHWLVEAAKSPPLDSSRPRRAPDDVVGARAADGRPGEDRVLEPLPADHQGRASLRHRHVVHEAVAVVVHAVARLGRPGLDRRGWRRCSPPRTRNTRPRRGPPTRTRVNSPSSRTVPMVPSLIAPRVTLSGVRLPIGPVTLNTTFTTGPDPEIAADPVQGDVHGAGNREVRHGAHARGERGRLHADRREHRRVEAQGQVEGVAPREGGRRDRDLDLLARRRLRRIGHAHGDGRGLHRQRSSPS